MAFLWIWSTQAVNVLVVKFGLLLKKKKKIYEEKAT